MHDIFMICIVDILYLAALYMRARKYSCNSTRRESYIQLRTLSLTLTNTLTNKQTNKRTNTHKHPQTHTPSPTHKHTQHPKTQPRRHQHAEKRHPANKDTGAPPWKQFPKPTTGYCGFEPQNGPRRDMLAEKGGREQAGAGVKRGGETARSSWSQDLGSSYASSA